MSQPRAIRRALGASLAATSLLFGAPAVWSQQSTSPNWVELVSIDTGSNQVGRLTSMGDGSMRRFFAYDPLGRQSASEHVLDGVSHVFTSSYGYPVSPGSTPGLGTVMRTSTYPDGELVAYGYDASGALQTITATRPGQAAQAVLSGIRRNARDQITQTFFGNGAVTDRTYDEATHLRLARVRTSYGAGVLADTSYGFDDNGNVTAVTDSVSPAYSATYGYDGLDQLTSMGGSITGTYGYDRLGNLTAKDGVTQTYGGTGRGPHALATSGVTTYSYDSNGNVTGTSSGLALTWNAENLATRASQSGIEKNRKWFLGDQLWKKVEGSTTTYYLPGLLIENGQPRKFYGAWAERSPDGGLRFYHSDHLGSSTVVSDSLGAVAHRIAYLPWGEDRGIPAGPFLPRFQFNFKEKDATGLYDYGARLYDPRTGRWMSPDPSDADGSNAYAYVRNNPVTRIDPDGRQSLDGLVKELGTFDRATLQLVLGFIQNPGDLPYFELVMAHLLAKEGFRDHGYYLRDRKVTFGIGSTFPVAGRPDADLRLKLDAFGITEADLRSGRQGTISLPEARFIAATHPDLLATARAVKGGKLTSFSFVVAASVGYQWGGGVWSGKSRLARGEGVRLGRLLAAGDDAGAAQALRTMFSRLIRSQPQYARGQAARRDSLLALLRVSALLRPASRISPPEATPPELLQPLPARKIEP